MLNLAVSATDSHHGHDPGLDGVRHDEVRRVRHAARHIERDYDQAFRANFFNRLGDVAAHQRSREDEQPHSREADDRAHGRRQLVLADERNGVDRDTFASDVVPIGLGNRAEGDLTDLGTAPHDHDPLAVDMGHRRHRRHRMDTIDAFDLGNYCLQRVVHRELEDHF